MKDLIKILDDYELDIFDAAIFESSTGESLAKWMNPLRSLIRNEMVIILEKGKYCRHNFNDELVIGSFLANGGAIAYWSALSYHGLTTQIPNTVFVQTRKRKNKKVIRGIRYEFVLVEETEFVGHENQGFGNHIFLITDTEKTLVDCLDKPQFCGDYSDLIRAIANSQPNEEKLIAYCDKLNNKAVTKRLGYLIKLFNTPNCENFIEFAQGHLVKGYALFDPKSENEGKYNNRWGLRLNISEETLKAIAQEGH
jgi:predicted transcriptional regulator of viral defense system